MRARTYTDKHEYEHTHRTHTHTHRHSHNAYTQHTHRTRSAVHDAPFVVFGEVAEADAALCVLLLLLAHLGVLGALCRVSLARELLHDGLALFGHHLHSVS
jgi:hypothetical protein